MLLYLNIVRRISPLTINHGIICMNQKAAPPYLHDLIARLAKINPSSPIFLRQKKVSGKDKILGLLSPELQRLWILRETTREVCEEIVQKIMDLEASHSLSLELGASEDEKNKFKQAIESLSDELRTPGMEFRILSKIFDDLLKEKFSPPQSKPVLGVREGFQVVCISDNSRGDLDTPFTHLELHRGLFRLVMAGWVFGKTP